MYVKDWMTKQPIFLKEDDSVMDAFNVFKKENFHRLPIVRNGNLVGLITETTLSDYMPSKATTLSIFEINSLIQKTKCSEIMIKDVVTICPDALLEEAADLMMVHNVTCLPVVENSENKLVGIITQKKIFGAFVDMMGYYTDGSRIVVEVPEDVPGIIEKLSGLLASNNLSISHIAVYRFDSINIVIRVYDNDSKKVSELLTANGYKVIDYRSNTK